MSCRSTPKSHVKRDMGGVWQPYVPQMGIPRGCRTDLRNPNEIFRINHVAQKFDESGVKSKRTVELPNAAKTSLIGSSVTPIECPESRETVSHRPAPGKRCSFESGFVPVCEDRGFSTRPQQGRVGEQSSHQNYIAPRRTNSETLRPPDNIAIGLVPLVDRDEESVKHSRPHVGNTVSSLGPGLVPLSRTDEENPTDCPTETENYDIPYVRVYGCKI
jgi:hypothetical protein